MSTHIRSLRNALPVAIVLLALGSAAALGQADVSGTVVDRDSGAALEGAMIMIGDTLAPITTGRDGKFTFSNLPVGEYRMRFVRPGYSNREETLRVLRPGAIDLLVDLTRDPFELDPIEVTATRSPFLARSGFYDRQELGLAGTFLDRADISRRDPKMFTDLFFSIPGTNLRSQGLGKRLIRFNRVAGSRGHPDGCVPDIYIDGIITGGRPGASTLEDHDLVDPRHVEAVEVYVGAATPIQYKSVCGVVLVWLRHR